MKCNGYTGYVTSKLPYSASHIRSSEPHPDGVCRIEAIPLWEIPRGWDVRVAQREVVRPRPAHAAPHTTLSDRGVDEKNVTDG